MAKTHLSKDQYRLGLMPHQFDRFLNDGFKGGEDIRALRVLLNMTTAEFASALGISEDFLLDLEASTEPPSAKLERRLVKAAQDPGTFRQMAN